MDERDFTPMPQLWVVCRYSTDRLYGGPEEGGWWYTAGELEKVVLSTRDEHKAYEWCRRLNDFRAGVGSPRAHSRMRTEYVSYDVVALPRWELKPEVARHLEYEWDYDPERVDYLLRWDLPAYFPEYRPHYS